MKKEIISLPNEPRSGTPEWFKAMIEYLLELYPKFQQPQYRKYYPYEDETDLQSLKHYYFTLQRFISQNTHIPPKMWTDVSEGTKQKIKDILKEILLTQRLEEKLCPAGKKYIAKRKAAGEKSSAYLSGRAVKVCKGQMEG
jgi:hypothetical protein